jgi:ribonuclease P protein subunit RPR2
VKYKYRKKSQDEVKIAKERINILFGEARKRFHEDSKLSDRYVEIARKIGMKHKVRIPKEFKRRFCKNCHKYLVPGVNCRVRLCKSKVVYYCQSCKNYMRIPYKKRIIRINH